VVLETAAGRTPIYTQVDAAETGSTPWNQFLQRWRRMFD
jgi:hypothetical protein